MREDEVHDDSEAHGGHGENDVGLEEQEAHGTDARRADSPRAGSHALGSGTRVQGPGKVTGKVLQLTCRCSFLSC